MESHAFAWLGLVPLAISAINAIANRIQEKKNQKRQNAANMEMAKYSFQANQEAIDKQNAYNTPAAQMQRFTDAGLSPNLIYSQGSGGTQQSAASFATPQVDMKLSPMQIPEVLGQYQDFELKRNQIDNVAASTEARRAQTATEFLKRMNIDVSTRTKAAMLKQFGILAPYQADIVKGSAMGAHARGMTDVFKAGILEKYGFSMAEQGLKRAKLTNEAVSADVLFRQNRNAWLKYGVTNSDHLLVRVLAKMLAKSGFSID